MQRFFSTKMPGVNFVMNVLVFSLIGLLPVLLVYVMRAPGFASALMDGGPALSRFLRQVLTNGLPVIFIVNYVGFFLGVLPGGGAVMSSLAAYATEKRISKTPEEFGRGSIKGVAAPETAS